MNDPVVAASDAALDERAGRPQPASAAGDATAATPGRPGGLEPIKVLLLALGGEGGGVLARWLVEAGTRLGHVVQSTSIPGVAQRTGATSYYIEWLPIERASIAGLEPVLCLSPMAGDLDLIVSSELLEAARAAERGLPDPQRTRVIASSSRSLTVAEKSAVADGRLAESALLGKLRTGAADLVCFDMQAVAREAGTVISAVMFGALWASGRLPLTREVCEDVVRAGGRGAQASLNGFALGADACAASARTDAGQADAQPGREPTTGPAPVREPGPAATGPTPVPEPAPAATGPAPTDERGQGLPAPLARMLGIGEARLRDYQDEAYALAYRERVLAWADLERALAGHEPDLPVTTEAARQLARWMAYEDVIRVADLKIRHDRFASLEREATAGAGGITRTWDFLKPGIDEIAAVLPAALASRLRTMADRRGWRALGNGVRLQTTGVTGLVAMRLLASLRPWRRRTARFAEEAALIDRWALALSAALGRDAALAAAIAGAPALIKGYSDTHARGRARFVEVLEHRIEGAAGADTDAQRAGAIRRALAAARADAQGVALAAELGQPAPQPVPQPIRFMPRQKTRPRGG